MKSDRYRPFAAGMGTREPFPRPSQSGSKMKSRVRIVALVWLCIAASVIYFGFYHQTEDDEYLLPRTETSTESSLHLPHDNFEEGVQLADPLKGYAYDTEEETQDEEYAVEEPEEDEYNSETTSTVPDLLEETETDTTLYDDGTEEEFVEDNEEEYDLEETEAAIEVLEVQVETGSAYEASSTFEDDEDGFDAEYETEGDEQEADMERPSLEVIGSDEDYEELDGRGETEYEEDLDDYQLTSEPNEVQVEVSEVTGDGLMSAETFRSVGDLEEPGDENDEYEVEEDDIEEEDYEDLAEEEDEDTDDYEVEEEEEDEEEEYVVENDEDTDDGAEADDDGEEQEDFDDVTQGTDMLNEDAISETAEGTVVSFQSTGGAQAENPPLVYLQSQPSTDSLNLQKLTSDLKGKVEAINQTDHQLRVDSPANSASQNVSQESLGGGEEKGSLEQYKQNQLDLLQDSSSNIQSQDVMQVTRTVEVASSTEPSTATGSLSQLSFLRYNYQFQFQGQTIKGESLLLREDVAAHLTSGTEKPATLSLQTMHEFVFVLTGVHFNYESSLSTIASIQNNFPNHFILYYDLGLTSQQAADIKKLCKVVYRTYDFDAFPQTLSETVINKQVRLALIIKDAFQISSGVFFLDNDMRINNSNLASPYRRAYSNGGVMFFDTDESSTYTDAELLKYLPTSTQLSRLPLVTPKAMLLYNTEPIFKGILWWWYTCSLDPSCMTRESMKHCMYWKDSVNRYADCRQSDQSILNILVANYFNFESTWYVAPTSAVTRATAEKGGYSLAMCPLKTN